LSKPTACRKAAMKTIVTSSHEHSSTTLPDDGEIGKCQGQTINLNTNRSQHNHESPKKLYSSSRLLKSTAASISRKTTPKKPIATPPTPKRYVTGASDRLMKPTAAQSASKLLSSAASKQNGDSVKHSRNVQQAQKHRDLPPINHVNRAARPLTVPRGPRCANISSQGSQGSQSKRKDAPTLAQRLDTFGKCLRDDFSVGSQGSNFSRRSLTIPIGPKLATDIRGGEKYIPPKINSDVALAESNIVLQNRLRSPYHRNRDQRRRGPTIPVSPKFANIPHRERPKSTAEIEVEQMEYFSKHQFKAKPPLPSTLKSSRFLTNNSSRSQVKDVPGFMKPTQVTKLNSRISLSAPTQSMKDRKQSLSVETKHHRSSGVPKSIITTNLGAAQRGIAVDDGLKDVLEHAARAAKALAMREEVRQQQLMEEEEARREQSTFRAKPIPRTTYEYNPTIPQPTGPLVEPFSPELQTKQRMKERKEFDQYAEQERLIRMENIKAIEDMRQADEDEEIYERRRLPVSEGGMIPMAAPVNAVLWNA
jgi:hypothetical protein